jgi:hypothetical protein
VGAASASPRSPLRKSPFPTRQRTPCPESSPSLPSAIPLLAFFHLALSDKNAYRASDSYSRASETITDTFGPGRHAKEKASSVIRIDTSAPMFVTGLCSDQSLKSPAAAAKYTNRTNDFHAIRG